jgi:uncharacterized protein YkwD
MRYVAALAAALTAVLIAAPVATPGSAANVERRMALEASVIREMNKVRAAEGLRPLHASPSLRTAARGHSRAMLEHGFFAHESRDGTAFSERIRRHYTNRGWMKWAVGEALLAGSGHTLEARAIVASRLDSPSHREILLSPTWRDAGIGALYAPAAPNEYGGAETIVVTADFGLREGKVTTT